jgi:hypothetical protein
MSESDPTSGPQSTVAELLELRRQFEAGEISCAAFRVYRADGTWEDVVLGGTAEERAEALAQLHAKYQRLI